LPGKAPTPSEQSANQPSMWGFNDIGARNLQDLEKSNLFLTNCLKVSTGSLQAALQTSAKVRFPLTENLNPEREIVLLGQTMEWSNTIEEKTNKFRTNEKFNFYSINPRR
jgi:hypothetical protein